MGNKCVKYGFGILKQISLSVCLQGKIVLDHETIIFRGKTIKLVKNIF